VVTTAAGKKSKKLAEHFLGYAGTGEVAPETPTDTFAYKGKSRLFHAEVLGGGDLCDLTKKPRVTEVRFVCDQAMLHAFESISETSTCNYQVIIHTSMICEHSDFTAETLVSRKALCVGLDTAPLKPNQLVALEEQLATEADLRIAEQEEAQRIADAQHADHLAKEQAKKGQVASGQVVQPKDEPVVANLAKEEAQPTMNAKQMKAAAKQLLSRFFQGKQCFSGGKGWWQHEFCYMKHVKQVHFNPDGSRVEVLIGKWDMDLHIDKIEAAGGHKSKNSMTHYYGNGDNCQEIDAPREVRVKMMCSTSLTGTQVALSLHETSTCKVRVCGRGGASESSECPRLLRGLLKSVVFFVTRSLMFAAHILQYTLKVQSALFCKLMKTVNAQGLFATVPCIGSASSANVHL
jgi:endoplasmic reticulum lectin 1